jgi:xanthine dehydrogenase large subunit
MDDGDIGPRERPLAVVRQPLAHDSAVKHVTGAAVYTDDILEPAGTLHAVPGYAPIAAGRATRLDLESVRKAPGVVEVLTAADIPGTNDISPKGIGDDPAITPEKVMFYGQVLFVVLAENRDAGLRARKLARIATAPGMPLIDVDDALVADSRVHPDYGFTRGDAADEIARSPRDVTGEFRMGGQEHFYLEGQVALAVPGEDGDILVHSSTQHPSEVQHVVAHVLGLDSNQVTVEVRRMGGGFGGKESQATQWAVLAALGARKTGRPVKLRLDRDDDMIMTGKRHDFRVDYHAGFGKDGVLRAVDVTLAGRCGYSEDLSLGVIDRTAFHADGAYFYPACRIVTRRMRTNTVSNTAFRGFGGPQGKLFAERMMDHIAFAIGRDPLDVRKGQHLRRCRAGPHALRHAGRGQHTAGDHLRPRADERVLAAAPADRGLQCHQPGPQEGHRADTGEVCHLLHPHPPQPGRRAGACLSVTARSSLNHGGTEMGQGLFVKVAQVVAEEFGVELGRVKITATSTAKVPNTSPTAASAGTDLNAQAAIAACRAIKDRLYEFILETRGLHRDHVQFRDGTVVIGNEVVSFNDLVEQAYLARISLSSSGFYRTPKIHWDRAKATGRPFYYFAYGASCSEVTIDTMTGEMKVDRVDILHDVGKSLNPAIDIGQIEGGFVQGMGWLTGEQLVWDSAGRLQTHAPSTYKIPTASDVRGTSASRSTSPAATARTRSTVPRPSASRR